MGDLINDLTDIIPSFAPTRSIQSDSPPSSPTISPTTNSIEALPPPRDTLGGSSTTPFNTTTPTPSPPPPPPPQPNTINNQQQQPQRPRNGTLSIQPKPGALVGTNGNSGTPGSKGGAGGTINSNVDGAASGSTGTTSVPVGAILGSVLAGVIMVTLAVTLLVALRKKSRGRNARLEPVSRNRSQQGRLALMEQGKGEKEGDVWEVKEESAPPQLPPLKLDWTSAQEQPSLGPSHSFRVHEPSPQETSPMYELPLMGEQVVMQRLHPSVMTAARPDSVGSIQDAPMNYVIALEERVPRSNLRVMNRVSNASVDD